MNRALINEKLDSLGRCLARLSQKRPATLSQLQDDIDLQDIIAINMERAVQLCVDIASLLLANTHCPPPQTMSDGFRQLANEAIISQDLASQLIKAVGFRNLAVHAYDTIDWSIVYSLLDDDLADLRAFGAKIADLNSE